MALFTAVQSPLNKIECCKESFVSPPPRLPVEHLSSNIFLSLGASKLSQEFVKGAEATGRAIHKGAAKIRDHITPEETPSEVSPRVTKGLQVAKQATGGAVRVSQFLGKDLNQYRKD